MFKNYIYIQSNNKVTIVGEFQEFLIDAEENKLNLVRGVVTEELININNSRTVSIVLEAKEGRIEYQNVNLPRLALSPNATKIVIKELIIDITDIEPQVFKEPANEFYKAFSTKPTESITQPQGITEAPGIF